MFKIYHLNLNQNQLQRTKLSNLLHFPQKYRYTWKCYIKYRAFFLNSLKSFNLQIIFSPNYREMLQKLTAFHGKLFTTNPVQPLNSPSTSPVVL